MSLPEPSRIFLEARPRGDVDDADELDPGLPFPPPRLAAASWGFGALLKDDDVALLGTLEKDETADLADTADPADALLAALPSLPNPCSSLAGDSDGLPTFSRFIFFSSSSDSKIEWQLDTRDMPGEPVLPTRGVALLSDDPDFGTFCFTEAVVCEGLVPEEPADPVRCSNDPEEPVRCMSEEPVRCMSDPEEPVRWIPCPRLAVFAFDLAPNPAFFSKFAAEMDFQVKRYSLMVLPSYPPWRSLIAFRNRRK